MNAMRSPFTCGLSFRYILREWTIGKSTLLGFRSQKGNPQVRSEYEIQFFFALFNIMMSVKVFALLALVAAASAVELNDDSFDGAIAGKSVSSTA